MREIPILLTLKFEWHSILSNIQFWVTFHFTDISFLVTFHFKWNSFSPTRPSGPSWSSSRDVCLFPCYIYFNFYCFFLFYKIVGTQYTVYSAHSTLYSVKYTVYIIHYTVYCKQSTLQCTVYSVHYAVYIIQCIL